MSDWTLDVTDEDIDRALAEAAKLPPRALATSAEYNRDFDMVVLHLDTGDRLLIPREQLQGLENATPEQLAHIEIFAGVDIAWPELDVDHYLPYLLDGKYSTEKWKEARRKARANAA